MNLLRRLTLGVCCLCGVSSVLLAADVPSGKQRVYFGTYTGKLSKGIYRSELDLATGKLSPPVLAGEAVNPSFLAIAPNQKFLYAVGELSDVNGKKGGAVNSFAIDAATGDLKLLNQQSSVGGGPCHIVVDRTGKVALVANYGGGSRGSTSDSSGRQTWRGVQLRAAQGFEHQSRKPVDSARTLDQR